jgi:hypothetical protein
VGDPLARVPADGDLVVAPELFELGALAAQEVDQLAGFDVAGVAAVDGAQVGDVGARVNVVVLLRVAAPLGGVREPPVKEAAL